MRTRFLIIVLPLIAVMFATFAPHAMANFWQYNLTTGYRTMLDKPGGTIIQEYSPGEWSAWRKELEAGQYDGYQCVTSCTSQLVKGETAYDGITTGEAEGGEKVIGDMRGAGTSLPQDVAAPMDDMAISGGVADITGGAAVMGAAVLGPTAFVLGVYIGNEIDELFGFPKLEIESLYEEYHSGPAECGITHLEHEREESAGTGGEVITEPPGYYATCSGAGGLAMWRHYKLEYANPECSGTTGTEGEIIHTQHTITRIEQYEVNEYGFCKSGIFKAEQKFGYASPECDPYELHEGKTMIEEWLEGTEVTCPPLGIPSVAPLSGTVQSSNEAHGKPKTPEAAPAVIPKPGLPKPGHAYIPNTVIERYTEIEPSRKYWKEHAPKTLEELSKEERESRRELVIPPFNKDELAVEYARQLEAEGFSNVNIKVVTESAENVEQGPEDVARVAPAPGTKAEPTTRVEVDENPADSPAPGEGPGGIGPPTLPGFKIPSFGVLCEGFPFGVPCWLVKAIEKWSSSAVAPEWGIEEMTILGHKIPEAKFKLSHLEPIMTPVRVAMVFFCTFGVLFLFYSFAKGGGPSTGTGGTIEAPGETFEHGENVT